MVSNEIQSQLRTQYNPQGTMSDVGDAVIS